MKNKYPNQPSRVNRLNLTISEEEKDMVRKLKKIHSVNISNYIRESIRELYNKLGTKT